LPATNGLLPLQLLPPVLLLLLLVGPFMLLLLVMVEGDAAL
jgi:hypothetical protein